MRSVVAGSCAFLGVMALAFAAHAHPPDVDDEGQPDAPARTPSLEGSAPLEPSASGRRLHGEPGPGTYGVRSMPRTLPYYEWSAIPAGYSLHMGGVRRALLIAGILTLGLSHTVSLVAAGPIAANCHEGCGGHVAESVIPVAGPFIAYSQQGKQEPLALYPALGVFQVFGFGMLLASGTLTDQRLVRDAPFRQAQFSLTPTAGRSSVGLAIIGSL